MKSFTFVLGDQETAGTVHLELIARNTEGEEHALDKLVNALERLEYPEAPNAWATVEGDRLYIELSVPDGNMPSDVGVILSLKLQKQAIAAIAIADEH